MRVCSCVFISRLIALRSVIRQSDRLNNAPTEIGGRPLLGGRPGARPPPPLGSGPDLEKKKTSLITVTTPYMAYVISRLIALRSVIRQIKQCPNQKLVGGPLLVGGPGPTPAPRTPPPPLDPALTWNRKNHSNARPTSVLTLQFFVDQRKPVSSITGTKFRRLQEPSFVDYRKPVSSITGNQCCSVNFVSLITGNQFRQFRFVSFVSFHQFRQLRFVSFVSFFEYKKPIWCYIATQLS